MMKPIRSKTYLTGIILIWISVSACIVSGSAPRPGNQAPTTTVELSQVVATLPVETGPTQEISATVTSTARPLELQLVGQPRKLPDNIAGASVEALVEHFTDNPAFIDAVKVVAPAYLRFPGGSQSNYYDWQDGLLHFNPQANSSAYYKYWAGIAPHIAQAFPQGVSMEQYSSAASQVGAEVILVPNLETSSVQSQSAWFKQLADERILPKDIELGNEFWIAMAGDRHVMQIWPDEPASMKVMYEYEQALRPIAGTGARLAVQASGASFTILPGDNSPFSQRLAQWDQALSPADWFDAVTIHLYPDPGKIATYANAASPQAFFQLMMGRSDAGIDRAINDVAARLPGKEIWVTEWNPRGGDFTTLNNPQGDKVPPQMNAQLIARTFLAFLRHPEVTKELFFMLYTENSALQSFVRVGNQYLPMVQTVVLTWMDQAANGGSTFQRVIDQSESPISGLGPFKESYLPVEGGLFQSDHATVLIIQNASGEARKLNVEQVGLKAKPASIEILVANNFTDTTHKPAQVVSLDPSNPVTLPPYSLVRVIWK